MLIKQSIKIVIFAWLFSDTLLAQNDKSSPTYDFTIYSGCGWGGSVSGQFNQFKELITAKKYSQISANIHSGDALTQLISVIALEELEKRKLLVISVVDRELISLVKRSEKRYYYCTGCTGHFYDVVKDIFNNTGWLNIAPNIRYRIGLQD